MTSPYDAPSSDVTVAAEETRYAGFWIRFVATIIDSILIMVVTWPLLIGIYGMEYLESTELAQGPAEIFISWVLPAVLVIFFWVKSQATPGKMLTGIKVVDAETLEAASPGQYVGRYFAYFISMLVLFLGYLWVAFDARKRAWHDMLAKTVVIHR